MYDRTSLTRAPLVAQGIVTTEENTSRSIALDIAYLDLWPIDTNAPRTKNTGVSKSAKAVHMNAVLDR